MSVESRGEERKAEIDSCGDSDSDDIGLRSRWWWCDGGELLVFVVMKGNVVGEVAIERGVRCCNGYFGIVNAVVVLVLVAKTAAEATAMHWMNLIVVGVRLIVDRQW